MRYAIDVPNYGDYFDPRGLATLAHEAEESGWDGFFIWDHIYCGIRDRTVDPWIALAAIAMRTERIRIGPMITPLPRRRPWKLAREAVAVDHLSGGRLTLGLGLGSPRESEFDLFGEEGDPRVRAEKLDEGLEVLTGLWSGEPFSYKGKHYQVDEAVFLPRPVQTPRIPIWLGGMWPNRAPLRRAARWDGVFPIYLEDGESKMTPEIMDNIVQYVASHRDEDGPFDVMVGGETPGDDPARAGEIVSAYAAAGVTWWAERIGPWRGPPEEMRQRVRQGPPRV